MYFVANTALFFKAILPLLPWPPGNMQKKHKKYEICGRTSLVVTGIARLTAPGAPSSSRTANVSGTI